MSKHSILVALCVPLGACGIADFDVHQAIAEQQIQGSSLPGPLATLFPIPVNLDLQSAIAAHDTGPIDSIELSALSLTITKTDEPAGDTDDWGFISSITLSVSSTKSGSTLPTVEVASVSMPGAVQTLTFVPTDGVNLKPYIDEGSTINSAGTGTAPADDVSFDGDSTFRVHPF